MALINRFNFIVWSTTPPEPEDLHSLPEGRNAGRASATVVLVPLQSSSIYINAPNGLALAGPPGGSNVVALVTDAQVTVASNIGELVPVEVPGLGAPQHYAFIVAPDGLRMGYYRLRIGVSGSYLYSNRVWYMPTASDWSRRTAIFSFRNQSDVAHVPYSIDALASFRQTLRLKVTAGTGQTDTRLEEYEEVTTGYKRPVEIREQLFVPFMAPHTDAIGHEGFRAMLAHKDLTVQGVPYSLKTGYQVEADPAKIAKATFELWQTQFGLVNRC